MISWLIEPWTFSFMQRALAEVAIVGLVCGVVGCFVVLRGLAFIGDALAHAVFPGVVLSYMVDKTVILGALVFGVITALGIGLLGRNRRVSEDSAIGILFAAFFALGVVLISREVGFRRDVASLLFGNILGISSTDILTTLVLAAVVLSVTLLLLKELTLVAFDSTMARAAGYPVFTLDMVLLLLVTTTIVISLQAVGNVLVLALVVTPPATARLLTDRLGRMLVVSPIVGFLSGVVGLLGSYHADTAAGASIVLASTAFFLAALAGAPRHGLIAGWIQRRRGEHHVHHYHPMDEEAEGA
ncbi:MAG: iron chelate uptake ABC transporter family permease subunit [Dehalococcoidia bacterium]|nr:metal ABC transporter permease [Dehalococcoidia bacterium]MCB9485796.1 metal ABC transporter permease [Thermoflexaceae bacterium]